MNYYNPYLYSMPTTFSATKTGLLSGLFKGGGIKLGSILSGTQRALGFVNQVIPVVKQVQPMFRNAKTMFKVMNEFKKNDITSDNSSPNNIAINNNTNNTSESTNNKNNTHSNSIPKTQTYTAQGPTFFI